VNELEEYYNVCTNLYAVRLDLDLAVNSLLSIGLVLLFHQWDAPLVRLVGGRTVKA